MTVTVGNGASMVLGYSYAREQFSDEAVIAMAGHMDGLLRALSAGSLHVTGEIRLPGDAETSELERWSGVRQPGEGARCAAAAHDDRGAVVAAPGCAGGGV